MAIKNLVPRLPERGRIKIGEKGEIKTSQSGKQFAQPKKLDHFVITTMRRDAAGRLMPDTALMSRLTEKAGNSKLTEIPVRLLYDDPDLNFMTRYACYRGARCWCSGDGEVAQRLDNSGKYEEVACLCERQDPLYTGPDKCKSLGTLRVLIEGAERVGGCWTFRTASWNSVNDILGSMSFIRSMTGGILAGIPLLLVLTPKTVTVPTTGQSMLVYTVSLDYPGTEDQLAELGYNIARKRIEHRIKMEQVEAEARKMLVPPHAESLEEQAETVAEFFPDGFLEDADQDPVESELCHICNPPAREQVSDLPEEASESKPPKSKRKTAVQTGQALF